MTARAPLVLNAGKIQQLQVGDSVKLSNLTATRIPFAAANGELVDDTSLSFLPGEAAATGLMVGTRMYLGPSPSAAQTAAFQCTGSDDPNHRPFMIIRDTRRSIPSLSSTWTAYDLDSKTIASIGQGSGASGGCQIIGYTDSGIDAAYPLVFTGVSGSTTPTIPIVQFLASKWDGTTTVVAIGSTETAFAFLNWETTLCTVSGNGNWDFLSGKLGFGGITPTARIHLPAGSATAGTAPIQFTSGPATTVAVAGQVEFTTDDYYATITTGAARKGIVLNDGTSLTATRVPFATTNGRLTDDADLTFAGSKLTATNIDTQYIRSLSTANTGPVYAVSYATLSGGQTAYGGIFTMDTAPTGDLPSVYCMIYYPLARGIATRVKVFGTDCQLQYYQTAGSWFYSMGYQTGLYLGPSSAGSVGEYYGFYAYDIGRHASSTATVGTAWAIYIEQLTKAATNWQVYSAGGNSAFGGNTSLGQVAAPTAKLHLGAGTATAGTAPVKFTSGTLTTIAVAGQLEYYSGSFFIRGTDILDVASKVAVPEIKTDTTTPTDLTITTGAAKTLVLATSVYDDLQFPISTGKVPAANYPDWTALTTNISAYAFAVDEYIDLQCDEMPHTWKEGTAGHVHLHFAPKTIQETGGNRFAKFTVWIAYADVNEVWAEHAAFTAEYTIPTATAALKHLYLDLGDMTLTNNLIEAQLKARVKRIAATGGTEYADDVFITQVGMHIEKVRLGSRAETTV